MQLWVSVNNLINENSEKKKTQKIYWTCRIYILERGHRKEKKISAGKFIVWIMMIKLLEKKQG